MASLRERLAALSSARAATSDAKSRGLPMLTGLRKTGVSIREQLFPFGSRRWLSQLRSVDCRVAQLISNFKFEISKASDWLFLDVETTGLAGGTGTYAFLIGLGRITEQDFCVRQFFLRDLAAERELLAALAAELGAAPLLVTYNGKLFDAPLLETRYRLARMRWPLDQRPHLDLLYPARRLWKLRCGSARLLELEQLILRHSRGDDVPGALIPQLYFDFLGRGDERPLEVVFQHNAEDLLTLAALAGRLLALAAAPEAEDADSLERVGLARLFERAAEPERAAALYECALNDHLPADAARAARLRLSFLYKRRGDYEAAARLWRELSENSADRSALLALEQLAAYYEHRLGEPERAAEATRRALRMLELALAAERDRRCARLTHRLRRLQRKLDYCTSFLE
ncbi:MAG TPA: ribonuclease H-like domain-containing protein [Candidatus Xenobia bacterium]|nr:ribonuclease H-like domain-containing protein [Candidatus Xenobia bacterium]